MEFFSMDDVRNSILGEIKIIIMYNITYFYNKYDSSSMQFKVKQDVRFWNLIYKLMLEYINDRMYYFS